MTFKKLLAGLLAILLIGLGAGGVYGAKRAKSAFIELAQSELQSATGLGVSLGAVSFSPFTGKGEIGEVNLLGTRADHKPLVQFRKVHVDVDPKSLIFGILTIRNLSAEQANVQIEGTSYGLKDLVSSLNAAGQKVGSLSGGPLVIIQSAELPGGKMMVGGNVFGRPIQASHAFGPVKLAALGENAGGEPLPKLLQQILSRFTANALGVADFTSILR